MARAPLPDPIWTDAASVCLGCGYSLSGLACPGQCPECGVRFSGRQLILAGIAIRAGGAPGRRAAWIALLLVGGLFSQLWLPLMFWAPWLILAISAALIGAVIYMLRTGPRDRHGTERFVVSPGGIARVAMTFEPAAAKLDSVFIPWEPAQAFEITRVSSVWRRLRVRRYEPDGTAAAVAFDAGFRCPDAAEGMVRAAIAECLTEHRRVPGPTRPLAADGETKAAR